MASETVKDHTGADTLMTEEEHRLWRGAKCQGDYDAVWKMQRERQAREAEEEWTASDSGRLLKRLGEAYEAYHLHLEQKPHVKELALAFDQGSQKIYERMQANLERANNAPRCAKLRANGARCRAPKVRGKKFCHMHLAMEEARPQKMELPALDDANGVQIAIAKAAQGVVDGTLDRQQAGLLGYILQLAVTNVGRVDFDEDPSENARRGRVHRNRVKQN
jgi:hypothetical protein